jgi:hypothetical protein
MIVNGKGEVAICLFLMNDLCVIAGLKQLSYSYEHLINLICVVPIVAQPFAVDFSVL